MANKQIKRYSISSDIQFSSFQSLSHVQLFATPSTATHQASLSITNSRSLLKPMSIESVMPSNHLILCCPFLLLTSIFPSIRVFSMSIRWPKYWNFSFSISPSNEYPGLISFRMDWLDLLAVQGTFKSLLQHHRSKASILRRLAFFIVQLSHPYITAGKTIALTRRTFVGKVMSLLLNMLSRFVSFSSKEQASFNFMAAITICSDFGAQKNKVSYCFHCFPIYLPWNDGTGCHDLSFLNVLSQPCSRSLPLFLKACVEMSLFSAWIPCVTWALPAHKKTNVVLRQLGFKESLF